MAQSLFFAHDSSPGSPFVLPHGMRLLRKVERVIRDLYDAFGYEEVQTPQLFRSSLWKQSGHWDKYRDNMFTTESEKRDTLERPRIRQTNIAQQSWIMVKRNMIHTKRMPEMLSDVTIQPIMFTVLFALGRLPGWIAHWREMHSEPGKIGRPRQIYTGAASRDYTALDAR